MDQGLIGNDAADSWNDWMSNQLTHEGQVSVEFITDPTPNNDLFLDPIGAFYDSQSTTYDQAASIATHTPVVVDAQGGRITRSQLQALDTNRDGSLSIAESQSLRLLTDLNENGLLEAGELSTINRSIALSDGVFYTQGNSHLVASTSVNAPTSPVANAPTPVANSALLSTPNAMDQTQAVPNSNYRTLRDTDNRYLINGGANWIDFSPNQIKINNSNRNILIGTDGNDRFDATYYSNYPQWINSGLLNQFMGGGGDDMVGGSNGNDQIWGGTGNDALFGYAGNDKLYGEEGVDLFSLSHFFNAKRQIVGVAQRWSV
jgi:Ca2+-binding RTX toxin-like protein